VSAWANVGIGAVILGGIIVLSHGVRNFRPQLARNVKYAEQTMFVDEKKVDAVRLAHPEIVKVVRLDRHPWFVVPHVMVLGYSISVFLGAKLTSNVLILGDQARYTMATCFFVSSLLVLTGATLGSRVGKWTVKRDVAEHLTAKWLGDDIVLPYRIEMAGMSAGIVSSTIYFATSFTNTAGSLGGWLTMGISILCAMSIPQWNRAVRVFELWDYTLVTEARGRLEDTDDVG
jgi:hypothetical protein